MFDSYATLNNSIQSNRGVIAINPKPRNKFLLEAIKLGHFQVPGGKNVIYTGIAVFHG
jgi:hypothetical protein